MARLAGVPRPVIERAKDILACLEEGAISEEALPREAAGESPRQQLSLFDLSGHLLLDELRKIDPDTVTPLEALNKLKELKDKAGA